MQICACGHSMAVNGGGYNSLYINTLTLNNSKNGKSNIITI